MTTPLQELITKHCQKKIRPDGTDYLSLAHKDETFIARQAGVTQKEVQIVALEDQVIPERYCRNQKSISCKEQISLLHSHVAVIGQGGLGGTVTEILARIGVGTLTLVDGDSFEESNLNRQLLATMDSLGLPKAEMGKCRVEAINPAVEAYCIPEFLTNDNILYTLKDTDLAVDCLDSIPDRFMVEDGCRDLGIPLVSAAIGGAAGQVMVILPGDTGLRAIYGPADRAQQKGVETRLGTLPYTATFMAACQCAEVVSLLCRDRSALQQTLLIANIDDKSFEIVALD